MTNTLLVILSAPAGARRISYSETLREYPQGDLSSHKGFFIDFQQYIVNIINMFDKCHLIKITTAIYRVTELFPEKEPLKFLIRKKANQILEMAVTIDFLEKTKALKRILSRITILEVYFRLAKAQGWVEPENFFVLEIEYKIIARLAKEALKSSEAVIIKKPDEPLKENSGENKLVKLTIKEAKDDLPALKPRQEKILQVLKGNGASQVRHISQAMPKCDKRVLRRDLCLLIERGLVSRIGNKTKTEYKLNQ